MSSIIKMQWLRKAVSYYLLILCVRSDIRAHDWVFIRQNQSFLLRPMVTTLLSFLHYLHIELTNARDLNVIRYLSMFLLLFLPLL